MKIVRRLIQDYWGILLILLAWQGWVVVNQFNPIVMPTPISVFYALATESVLFLENTAITFAVAVLGTAGGMIIGTSLAIVTWLSPLLSGLVSPLAILFQFGSGSRNDPDYRPTTWLQRVDGDSNRRDHYFFSPHSCSLRPVCVLCRQEAADLFQVLGASRRATLLHLALPAAMPNLAIAFRLAAAYAILAAMIAEFLMGTSGLGYLFAKTNDEFQTEQAFGTSVIATVISVTAFLLTSYVERRVRTHYS